MLGQSEVCVCVCVCACVCAEHSSGPKQAGQSEVCVCVCVCTPFVSGCVRVVCVCVRAAFPAPTLQGWGLWFVQLVQQGIGFGGMAREAAMRDSACACAPNARRRRGAEGTQHTQHGRM